MRKIGFSNSCLWHQYKDIFSAWAMAELKISGLNAIEIAFDPLTNEAELYKILPALKKFKYVSLHLGTRHIFQNDNITRQILEKTQKYSQLAKAQLVVIHPDRVKSWSILQKYPLVYGVENMDSRKKSFYQPASFGSLFKRYPKLKMVLDLNHCYDNDPSLALAEKFKQQFKNKIKEVHLSGFQAGKLTHHGLLYKTQQTAIVAAAQSLAVPVIIESSVDHHSDLKKELSYVINNLSKDLR